MRKRSVVRATGGVMTGTAPLGEYEGKIGFHGGKVEIERSRLRGVDGKERAAPSWEAATAEDRLSKWAINGC